MFDTHLHADHLSGARDLADATGATLHLNPADTFAFDYTPLHDGDRYQLPGGVALSVAALHTPGHTMGSTIYFVGNDAVLTGDTLFVDGVGRPDLADRAEEFAHNLYHSLQERVLTLPEDTFVLPGHYGEGVPVHPHQPVGAPLAELRRTLEPLQLDEDALRAPGPPTGPRPDPRTTSRSSRPTWAGPRSPSPRCNASSSAPTAAPPPEPPTPATPP